MSRFRGLPGARGVLLVTGLCFGLLIGCGAGQKAQTAEVGSNVDGASGEIGDVKLRFVRIAYPSEGRYAEGQDARLEFVAVNDGNTTDTLINASSDVANEVLLVPGSSETSSPSVTATASQEGSPPPPGPGSPTTPPPGPEPVQPEQSAQAPASTLALPIQPQGILQAQQDGPQIMLVGLKEPLLPGQNISVTFTFSGAGDVTITVPIAVPDTLIPTATSIDLEHAE